MFSGCYFNNFKSSHEGMMIKLQIKTAIMMFNDNGKVEFLVEDADLT